MKGASVFCLILSVLLVLLRTIDLSVGNIEAYDYRNISILSPCLLSLVEKYFKSKKVLRGSLIIVNILPKPSSFLQRRILKSLNEDERHLFTVMTKNARLHHKNASRVPDKAQNYLAIIKQHDDVTLALKQWKSLPTWNPNAQTVALLVDPIDTEERKNEMVKQVFEELLNSGHIFANAMYQMESNPYQMKVDTWFPYFNQSCASTVENIYTIEECDIIESVDESGEITKKENITAFNQEMYPKIPNTLNGCQMGVSTVIWEPFVVGNDTTVESGLEILMLETITGQMELKLKFNILKGEVVMKKITDDNKTGIYADLLQKESDLMLGGLYENSISRKLVSSSIPYYQDDITWCVSKAGLAPTWLNVFIIFSISTWFGIIVTLFITSGFLFYFIRREGIYRENYAWTLLIAMAIQTGQYGHYFPVKGAIKIFLGTMFVFGLHINTAYHSYLINVLTNPRYNDQINTVEEAIKAGMTFEVGENTVDFFKKEDPVSKHLLLNHKICHDMDQCFKTITKDRTKALAISRAHALNNPFGLNEDSDFFCFHISENIYVYSTVMMFRRFHYLLPIINEKIRTIGESGLLMKWQKDSSAARTSAMSDADKNKDSHGSVQIKLQLEHVVGAFLAVLIGLSIAFIVFLLELLIHWLIKKKKCYRLVTMESFLCHA